MDKTKIFITYKDKHKIIKSNILTPIQTGRAIADENFEEMLGDNTGDNISALNPNFCEMSAIYWAWKHYEEIGAPEYIGFMHYRRHFLFGNKNYVPAPSGLVEIDNLDEKYLEEDITDDNNIFRSIKDYDAIFPQKIAIIQKKFKNNYQQYKYFHVIKNYDNALRILNKKFPEYSTFAKEYNKSQFAYFLNMFILKKEIFFKYCEFVFTILFELKDNIIYTKDSYQDRALGFIAERLTGIFFEKLKNENIKIKELPVSFVKKGLDYAEKPDNESIPIVCSSSNLYVPYLSVFLQSIKEHVDKNYKYKIYILNKDISSKNKLIIKNQIEQDNITLKFINISKELERFKGSLHLPDYVTIESYSRICIPQLITQHDKCIYLDIDIICLDDLKKLYYTDMNDCAISASRCTFIQGLYNSEDSLKDYIHNTLNLETIDSYFQAGILVFDLKKIREQNLMEKAVNIFKTIDLKIGDQCLLNVLFKGNVNYIDMSWNYEVNPEAFSENNLLQYISGDIKQKYLEAQKHPKVLHYQGTPKPWECPRGEFADLWWKYAKKTPFIQEIEKRHKELVHKIRKKLSRKITKYSVLSKITLGEKQKYYQKKLKLNKKYLSYTDFPIEIKKGIKPIFEDNYTTIAMSCSSEYVPYLSVCLQSLIEHADSTHNYDILVFERSINNETKNILKNQIQAKNISLRFINPMPIIKEYDLKVHSNYAIECYFRLAAPRLLSAYKRVVFTDIDLIFNSDIKNLDNVDITNKPLAACKDLMFGAFLNYPDWDWLKYSNNVLKLQNPYKYFNTGVMIFNIEKLNSDNFTKNILDLVSKTHFRILEQDGLNAFYQDNIKYMDTSWNYASEITSYKHLMEYMPEDFYKQYIKDKAQPSIIHWAGADKPWFNPSEEFADLWWKYAEKTPFIQQLKTSYTNYWANNKAKFVRKYKSKILKYSILSRITFGNKKEYYLNKYNLNVEYLKKYYNKEI